MKPLSLFLTLLFLFISPMLGACSETEEEPVKASFQLIHGVADLGEIEVLVDQKSTTGVALNSFSETIDLDPGTHQLTLRSSGAAVSLLSQSHVFEPQMYLFILRGLVSDQSLRLEAIDEVPPTLSSEESAVEVVNLLEAGAGLDVYVDGTLVGDFITSVTPPAFTKTNTGQVLVEVYNGGSMPGREFPIFSDRYSLSGGHAYMFLLQRSSGNNIEVNSLKVR